MATVYLDGFEHQDSRRYETGASINYPTGRDGVNRAASVAYNSFLYKKIAPAHDTLIVGIGMRFETATAALAGGSELRFYNNDYSASHLTVKFRASGTGIQPYVVRGSDSVEIITGSVIQPMVWFHLGLVFTPNASAGSAQMYMNEVSQGSYSGALKNGGTTDRVGGIFFNRTTSSTDVWYIDDLFIFDGSGTKNNAWPGDLWIRTLRPNADGSINQWLGSDGNSTANWQLVDETGPLGTDYVGSATVGQRDSYALPDLTGTTGVLAAQVSAIVSKSDAGPAALALQITANSALRDCPTVNPESTMSFTHTPLDEASPGVAWTPALVNSMQAGQVVK